MSTPDAGNAGSSLLDDIEASITKTGPRCAVALLLEDLPPDEGAAFTKALAITRYPGTKIAEAMARRGHRIPADTIQRHRRGHCQCPT